MTMRIYVGTYAAYNEGDLRGKWFDLEDYDDKHDFLEAAEAYHRELLGDEDEDYPADIELMFQDWEGIPSDMVGESWVAPEVWELMEAFNNHDEDVVRAYLKCFGEWNESDFQDRYRGQYDSWEDFAEQLVDELGYLDEMPEHLRNYFDYEKYARDLKYDFCEEDGYYFWNN